MSGARGEMPHDPHELLAEYALGTLEPTEAVVLEAYLARSARARAELQALQSSLVTLTEALPPVAPPPEVWSKISAALAAERAALPLEAGPLEVEPLETTTYRSPSQSRVRRPQEPHSRVTQPTVIQPRAPRRFLGRRDLGWWLAACFCLLAVGELVWGVRTQQALRQVTADERLIADFLAEPSVGRTTLQDPAGERLGGALIEPEGEVLFVLANAPSGRVYQAWGHQSDDWQPGSREQLTSLAVTDKSVFTVAPGEFVALYLSLEPAGGSVQPTEPLARVTLSDPLPDAALEISSPPSGSVLSTNSVIVSGLVDNTVAALSYRVNGGEPRRTPVSGTRFTFTVSGLQPGENTVEVSATVAGRQVTERVILSYAPQTQ